MTKYDLELRTKKFSLNILKLCRNLPTNIINRRLIDQLVRASTSIGANYREANECDTRKDLKNKIRIAKKEARETTYWLDLVSDNNPITRRDIDSLKEESLQLMRILATIYLKI